MSHARQAGRSLVWPLIIAVVVIAGLAVGAYFIFGGSKAAAEPAGPTNLRVTVGGTELAPTMTVTWDPIKDATGPVKYVANYATARLNESVVGKPFKSPCLQLSKSTTATTVVLPAPFNMGVFYVAVVAQVDGQTSAQSAPVLVYGPFSKHVGQTYKPSHPAKGSIPATLWCQTQGLTI
jgi:hypothetical protein